MANPQRPMRTVLRIAALAAAGLTASTMMAACAGAGGAAGSGDANSINVLMVNNPQMVDLEKLTANNFTKQTGIKVNFTVLPEDDLRDKASQDFSSQAAQYDVATLSNYEVPFYAKNGWLTSMSPDIAADPGFDQSDILPTMRDALTVNGQVYAEPFYGESSFLMYRKDIFAQYGLTMPANPTWQQVADLAALVDNKQAGMRGICLRGQPGWGENIAPLTTVVNTFGGTWFDKDWNAELTSPAFENATNFYVNLVRQHGEAGAAQSGFTECLNDFEQGKVAMWYDATSAAGSLEGSGSPVAGKVGYVAAPVDLTKASGWLYTWAFAIEKASTKSAAAWKFVSWASSTQYEDLVGQQLGWAQVPAGYRASLYDNPAYQQAAGPFYKQTEDAITSVNPDDPGVQPRPTPGIQFVDIPEFTDLGTQVSQEISSAIAGQESVSTALSKGQSLAATVAKKYQQK